MQLFFMEVYEDIDWSKGFVSLEQELREIAYGEDSHQTVVDKLIRVYRKNGNECLVYIHVEIQSQQDKKLPRRMFIYKCKLLSKQKIPLMSLAVLGDDNPRWRPNEYKESFWGCTTHFTFQTVKLLDFKDRVDELKESKNPFAFFVIAHLRTLETKKSLKQRLTYKEAITIELLNLGLSEKEASNLVRFIDALMTLPRDVEIEYIQHIRTYQEEHKMPFLAPFEIIAMEEGMEEGMEKGMEKGNLEEARLSLTDNLEEEFGSIPYSMLDTIQNLQDIETIRRLRRQALKISSLDEFRVILNEAVSI